MAYKLLMALFPRFSMCSKVDMVAACKGAARIQLKHQPVYLFPGTCMTMGHRLEFIPSSFNFMFSPLKVPYLLNMLPATSYLV